MLNSPPQPPLYIVSTGLTRSLPLCVEDVFLITSNFDFACCVCSRLPCCPRIVRVTRHNNWLYVSPQATQSIRHLERLRDHRHGPYFDPVAELNVAVRTVRCLICVKVEGMWCKKELLSVRASVNLPPQHLARCYPYVLHEWLNFDQLNPFRHTSTPSEQAALQRAKLDWEGQQFFAEALSSRLPSELIWLIQETCLQSCIAEKLPK